MTSKALPTEIIANSKCRLCDLHLVEPYVTSCGHSFCRRCISLRSAADCPDCRATNVSVFPNHALHAALIARHRLQLKRSEPDNTHDDGNDDDSGGSAAARRLLDHLKKISAVDASQLDAVIDRLTMRRTEMQRDSHRLQPLVLLHFLLVLRDKNLHKMQELTSQLAAIDADLAAAQAHLLSTPSQPSDDTTASPTPKLMRMLMADDHLELYPAPSAPPAAVSFGACGVELQERRRRLEAHLADLQSNYFARHANADSMCASDSAASSASCSPSPLPCTTTADDFAQELLRVTRYTKLQQLATLRHPSQPNISAVGLDREERLMATTGLAQCIQMFDLQSILDAGNSNRIIYPVREITTAAKLSSLSWDHSTASHLATGSYEGNTSVWDVQSGRLLLDWSEHQRQTWCVDFCVTDPARLASGSNDGTVKVWSMQQACSVVSVLTHSSVCSVQWSRTEPWLLAYGSADGLAVVIDIRKPQVSLFRLRGHRKAVSYVQWMSGCEVVTASTDSTLRLWNLESAQCLRTFAGHQNDKHFIGLGLRDDLIACGGENHAVHVYQKDVSQPVAALPFSSRVGTAFVSAVCWRKRSDKPTLLAADSQGAIKLFQLL